MKERTRSGHRKKNSNFLDDEKRLAIEQLCAEGICGACKGEKVVTAIDAIHFSVTSNIIRTKRTCLGCDGTGTYPPQKS